MPRKKKSPEAVEPKPVEEAPAAEAAPTRKPIPVAVLQFEPTFDSPGMHTSTLSDKRHNRQSRHTLEFLPWMRHFRVTYHSNGKDLVQYVHETHPRAWMPLEV